MVQNQNELILRAVKGDEDALVFLLEQHGARIRQRLRKRIPDKWRPVLSEDDVLQQTYADAFHDIGRFDPKGADGFAGWLWRIAEHNLLDGLKMLQADKRPDNRDRVKVADGEDSLDSFLGGLVADASTPSRQVARKEAKSLLLRALRQLPSEYRQVVELYDLEGRPSAEVARTLNRSRGAMFMLRARAHSRLRTQLGRASHLLSSSA
jgi:RNA polymerase sigma factor (sigma-70 family)